MRASGNAYGSPAISTSNVRNTESVSGSCNWGTPAPCPGCDETRPAPHPTSLIIVWTTSSPTPRPEISVTVSFIVKPGRKRNSSSSASLNFSATSGKSPGQFLNEGAPHDFGIDPVPIVGHLDQEHARAMTRLQPDRPSSGLPRAAAVRGRYRSRDQSHYAKGDRAVIQRVPGFRDPPASPRRRFQISLPCLTTAPCSAAIAGKTRKPSLNGRIRQSSTS